MVTGGNAPPRRSASSAPPIAAPMGKPAVLRSARCRGAFEISAAGIRAAADVAIEREREYYGAGSAPLPKQRVPESANRNVAGILPVTPGHTTVVGNIETTEALDGRRLVPRWRLRAGDGGISACRRQRRPSAHFSPSGSTGRRRSPRALLPSRGTSLRRRICTRGSTGNVIGPGSGRVFGGWKIKGLIASVTLVHLEQRISKWTAYRSRGIRVYALAWCFTGFPRTSYRLRGGYEVRRPIMTSLPTTRAAT